MLSRNSWSGARALNVYRGLAKRRPDDWLVRYGWTDHDQAEADSIYDEVIAKIPAGATKVLEIGCGDGRFYRALNAAEPGLDYLGIDIVPENIAEAATAKGTVTADAVEADDTITIEGVTLTAGSAQGSGDLDFDATGDDRATASSIVAAINDAGNGLSGTVVASNNSGLSAVVTVRAATAGTGGNALALASSNGTRLAVSGATLDGGLDPALFAVGNAAEFLAEATVDWDFIVSIGCLFDCTDTAETEYMFHLLDTKASKGFMVLASPQQIPEAFLDARMTEVLATSTNVADSYYTGARDFLLDALVKGMRPFYVHRDATTRDAAAALPERLQTVVSGRMNGILSRQDAREATRAGEAVPSDFTGVTTSGGLVTGTEVAAIDDKWVDGLKTRTPPVIEKG